MAARRRSGRRRHRWSSRLRHWLLEHRFVAAQLAFAALGLLVGLSFWSPADHQAVDHRVAWRDTVHDIEATEEAAARSDWDPSGVVHDVVSEEPRGEVSRGLSTKEDASGTPEPTQRRPTSPHPSELANTAPKAAGPDTAPGPGVQVAQLPAHARPAAPELPAPARPAAPVLGGGKTGGPMVVAVPVLRPSPQSPAVRFGPGPEAPAWLRNAAATPTLDRRPAIAIVIDDLGMNRRGTAALNHLKAPLTLSFLPYASDLESQTRAARAAGHELLLHVPMEPRGKEWPGPNALLTSLSPEELVGRLRADLNSFHGFVGINNHMGSRLTADRESMSLVMEELRRDNLLFLDSRTIGGSVAADEAKRHEVPFAVRDVFLDNRQELTYVLGQLAEVERVAKHHGTAIAIGHPHHATIMALRRWLPSVERRGFVLVPLSTIVAREACADGLIHDICGGPYLAAAQPLGR